MSFNANGNNFKSLLLAPRVYNIPHYQRDFSWDNIDNY